MLPVVRVHRARNQDLDGTYCVAVESIHKNRIHGQTLVDDIGLTLSRVDIDLIVWFGRRVVSRIVLLLRGLSS